MKRGIMITISVLALAITAVMLILTLKPFSAATPVPAAPVTDEGTTAEASVEDKRNPDDAKTPDESHDSSEVRQINIYVPFDNDGIHRSVEAYAKKHWNFEYEIKVYTGMITYSYSEIVSMINNSLISGDGAVDIYRLPARYTPYYIKGDYSRYACTYKELGIDVDTALKNAEIPEYAVEAGLNPDGELIALPYLAEPCVFLYNRAVARDVWGTDDPDKIVDIIGGGTQKWDKFIKAAKTLKRHGYYIVPGFTDLSYMVNENVSSAGQGPDNGYGMDPVWEEYMDVSKQLFDSGCINDTISWTGQWFDDLKGKGNKVFGIITNVNYIENIFDETTDNWAICLSPFTARMDVNTGIMVSKDSPNKDLLGPLVEWMTLDCSEEGLQYGLASGTLFSGKKMAVLSGTVLKNADNSRDILGGQNIGSVILDATNQPMGKHYGDGHYLSFDFIEAYLKGETDKKTAISKTISSLRKNEAVYGPLTEPSTSASDSAKGEVIVWKDKNLESAVREALFMPHSDIYTSDAKRVTNLRLGKDVTNFEDLVHLKNLTSLRIESAKVTDISFLKDLTNLEVLYMQDNNISDISVLSGLTKLEELDMSKNAISDISSLSGLKNLKYINLSYNAISDISALKKLAGLNKLNLEFNDIKDISSLRTLKKLETLYLNGNEISDISCLRDLRNLKELRISAHYITDRSPADHVESVSW